MLSFIKYRPGLILVIFLLFFSNNSYGNNFFKDIYQNFKIKLHHKIDKSQPYSFLSEDMMTPFTYDNTNAGTFSNQVDCNTVLTRTFNVTDDFLINDLDVGLNLSHTLRGNLLIKLTSPSGITTVLIAPTKDTNDNFNLLLDDDSTNPTGNNSNDALTPLYDANRTAAPHAALANYNGTQAKGTWTMTFCNTDVFGDGTATLDFNSARLVFDGRTAASCTIYSLDFTTTCYDNGTPTINDDYYEISLIVNGVQLGSGFSVDGTYGVNSFTEAGLSYNGQTTLSEQIPIGLHTSLTITDADNPGCSITTTIVSPSECSTPFKCWAISDEGDESLYEYNSATNTWTDIGQTGVSGIEALAYDPFNGIIYTANNDEVGTVNQATGAFMSLANLNIGVLSGPEGDWNIADIDGLTFDPNTGILWASERRSANGSDLDYIFQIDITTGNFIADAFGPNIDYVPAPAVFDPVNGQNVHDIDDIAIDPYSGDLHAISNQGGQGGVLTILNKTDGTVKKVIGNFAEVDDMEALGFFNSGTLYGSTGNNSPDPADLNRYFLINKLDATLTEQAVISLSGNDRDFEACDCLSGLPNRIAGTVFHDQNVNGQLTGGEPGLSNMLVYLYRDVDADSMFNANIDILLDTVLTDANGDYEFNIASTGDFFINIETTDLPAASSMTTDNEEAALFVSTGQEDLNNDFGFAFICDLNISEVTSSNCTGSGPYTAQWDMDINYVNEPVGDLNFQRNSDPIQTITPSGSPQTIVFTNVPADGGLYDTLKVWFSNEITCGDTIILKRPLPCPGDIATCSNTSGCLGGNVFEDYNCNGIDDTNEPGVQGIEVQVYDCNNNIAGTGYSDGDGDWQVCGLIDGAAYRVEFILPEAVACWATPTHVAGGGNQSDIQFLTAPACTQFSVSSASDYCEANPQLIISCYENGIPDNNMNPALISFSYAASGLPSNYDGGTGTNGTAENPMSQVRIDEIGAVNGAAWQAGKSRLFNASFLKRYVGFLDGPGFIYVTDFTNGSASGVTKFDLQGFTPANGGTAIDFGTVCRDATCANDPGNTGFASDYELGNSPTEASIDLDAFAKVGAMSYGDIDLQGDGKTLWAVNLFQKALITVDVSGNTGSLPGAINQYLFADLPGIPTCTNGEIRPWGLAFHKGTGYLGVICDASVSLDSTDLEAFVLSFNPNNISSGFTTVMNFSLDFPREIGHITGPGSPTNMNWLPWAPDWNTLAPFTSNTDNNFMAPQPILADIEFNERGDMIMGFMDRFGHQNGRANRIAVSQTTESGDTNSGGDLVHACYNGTGWTLEGAGGCPNNDNNPTGDPFTQLLQNDGPNSNGEFYYEDYFSSDTTDNSRFIHAETATGLLTLVKGKREIISTHYDPLWGPPSIVNAQGIVWHNTFTGEKNDAYQIVESSGTGTETFAKANGLGDFQAMCGASPLEIGNYVWCDSIQNGIQDGCERGINEILVQLFDRNGNLVGQDTTSNSGQYYFNQNNVDSTGITVDGSGIATPVSGSFTGMSFNTQYFIVFGGGGQFASDEFTIGSETYGITSMNDAGSNDNIDSDVDGNNLSTAMNALPAGLPFIDMTTSATGCGDHKYDLGVTCQDCFEITELISNREICTGENIDTLAALTTFENPDSIAFVYFTNAQTDSSIIYTNGIGIDTVQIAVGNDTVRITDISGFTNTGAAPSTFYVYAIAHPIPSDITCRPFEEILVIVNPLPDITTNDATICLGESQELTTLVSDANNLSGCTSFYTSLTDAQNETNALTNTNVSPTDTTEYFVRKNTLSGNDTIVISEVEHLVNDRIELMNLGSSTVDISTWQFCSRFSYAQLNSLAVVSGSLTLASGEKVVIEGFSLDNAADLGLYRTAPFSNQANMVDFVQWGSSGNGRESVAAGKGIWTAGTFVPAIATSGNSLQFDGDGNTVSDWMETTENFGFQNSNFNIFKCFTIDSLTVNVIEKFYSLGNQVFEDTDNSGDQNGAEAGIDGIQLQLLNADGSVYDSDPNTAGIQALTVTTTNGGYYRFDDLPAGDYIVEVLATNFDGGNNLNMFESSTGANQEATPDSDGDLNDNGLDTPVAGAIRSGVVTIGGTEPLGEVEPGSYGAGSTTGAAAQDDLSNLTVDFGFYRIPADYAFPRPGFPPCPQQPCHIIDTDLRMGATLSNDDPNSMTTDDSDGTEFPNNLRAGTTINVRTTITNNTGRDAYLYAWVDWNDDDDFDDAGENFIVATYPAAMFSGMYEVSNSVFIPSFVSTTDMIAMRFRLSSDQAAIGSPCGPAACAADGEVEDYEIQLECPNTICLPTEIQINRE